MANGTTEVGAPPEDPFLVREYAHLAESFLRNEESGEKRVTVFLLLCGAAGTAGAFVRGNAQLSASEPDPLIVVTVVVLLVLGYATQLRLIHRNISSDSFREALRHLREYLGVRSGPIGRVAISAYGDPKPRHVHLLSLGKGGWLETVLFVEAILAGTLIADLAATGSWWKNSAWGLTAAAACWLLLAINANRIYQDDRKARQAQGPDVTHR